MGSPEIAVEEVDISSTAAQAICALAVDELDHRYGPDPSGASLELGGFAPPGGAFLVARMGSELVGGVGYLSLGSGVSEVKRLWVRPDCRRSGVGRLLMAELVALAAERGIGRLVLETGPLQPEAIALYESGGWQRVAELDVGGPRWADSLKFSRST